MLIHIAPFAELNKELSRTSHISRVQSRQSRKGATHTDVEKAEDETSSEEQFDLETVLRGNRDEEESAGIKSKRIGVVFEDLTVSGIGGVKNYVKTFPDAFVSFFNVYESFKTILGLGRKGREFDILKNFRGVVKPGEMCLVLGRPGSGCTTFLVRRISYTYQRCHSCAQPHAALQGCLFKLTRGLTKGLGAGDAPSHSRPLAPPLSRTSANDAKKVAANQRYGYTKVGGKVLYGPFESEFFEKRYRGYVGEVAHFSPFRLRHLLMRTAPFAARRCIVRKMKITIPRSRSAKRWTSR